MEQLAPPSAPPSCPVGFFDDCPWLPSTEALIGAIVGLGVALIMMIAATTCCCAYKRGRGQAAGDSSAGAQQPQPQPQPSEQRADVAIQISEVATVEDEEPVLTVPDTEARVADPAAVPSRDAEVAGSPSQPSQPQEPAALQEVDVTLVGDAELEAAGAKDEERSRRRRKHAHRAAAIPEPTAENVEQISKEHRSIKARLREYEAAFEERHGRKPRKKKDWAPVYVDYERYAALREAEKQARQREPAIEASSDAMPGPDPPAESQ